MALVGREQQPVVRNLNVSSDASFESNVVFHPAVSGTVCTVMNSYYSQCLPGVASAQPPPPTPVSSGSAPTGTGTAAAGLSSIPASTLTQFSNFGTNPNNVEMFVYKPKKVAANPPLIVASHCESNTQERLNLLQY